MQLKDLENILVGNIRFRLVTKNFEGNFENIDEILPYEIQYLPANLRKENVLKILAILLVENSTFLDLFLVLLFIKNLNSFVFLFTIFFS